MKRIFTLVVYFIAVFSAAFNSSASSNDRLRFYRIRLDSDINKAAVRLVLLGLEKAADKDADFVILDIDTYGGEVDAADSIRSTMLRSEIPVLAYVNLQAASAGALISISCDSIYMKRGSSIGAATVVDGTGKVMPDKYQSFMRGMMRSTAEARGRDPRIAQAMVDTAGVLSLTAEEAVEAGYCEGIYESAEELAQAVASGREYVIENLELDWLDKLIQFLMNPLLQSIFLMMIVGGIYIEIRTPGIGLPLAIAVAGAFLYFSPLIVENLAQYWEVALFLVGILLIGLELFVIPGFGVCGVSGIVAVIFSLVFAMIDNDLLFNGDGNFDIKPILVPISMVSISAFAAVMFSIWIVRKLYATRSFDYIALRQSLESPEGFVGVRTDLESFIGAEATVFTDLKPSGKVVVDGNIYEATLNYGYASKGDKVKVILAEQGRLYCQKL